MAWRDPRLGALAIAAVVAIGASASWADRREWAGSAACGSCHPQQLAAWQRTRHATTQDRFSATVRPDGRCLACHATGEAPAGMTVALEVGCEACHGAGAAYAEDDVMRNRPVARALGLLDLSTPKLRAALCTKCHARGTRGTSFDPTAPVHPVPPPAGG
ncbi:MAG: multiheme c-type cytochrome [Kofleriaceae bacterium]